MDPSTDLRWNNTTAMLSADDSVNVDAGSSVAIRILENDTLPELPTGAGLALSALPKKSGTTGTVGTAVLDTSTGIVTYNAPDNAHGEIVIPYTVTLGARTTSAVIHAWVKPHAADLSFASHERHAADHDDHPEPRHREPDDHHVRREPEQPERRRLQPRWQQAQVHAARVRWWRDLVPVHVHGRRRDEQPPGHDHDHELQPRQHQRGTRPRSSRMTAEYVINMQAETGNSASNKVVVTVLPTAGDGTLNDGTVREHGAHRRVEPDLHPAREHCRDVHLHVRDAERGGRDQRNGDGKLDRRQAVGDPASPREHDGRAAHKSLATDSRSVSTTRTRARRPTSSRHLQQRGEQPDDHAGELAVDRCGHGDAADNASVGTLCTITYTVSMTDGSLPTGTQTATFYTK